jgi:hypothetical protein
MNLVNSSITNCFKEIVNLIIEQTKLDHVKQSHIRDQIIEDQHKKIDNMNKDFTDMMRETLDKVTGRIEKTQKASPTQSDFIPTSVLTKLKELQS